MTLLWFVWWMRSGGEVRGWNLRCSYRYMYVILLLPGITRDPCIGLGSLQYPRIRVRVNHPNSNPNILFTGPSPATLQAVSSTNVYSPRPQFCALFLTTHRICVLRKFQPHRQSPDGGIVDYYHKHWSFHRLTSGKPMSSGPQL